LCGGMPLPSLKQHAGSPWVRVPVVESGATPLSPPLSRWNSSLLPRAPQPITPLWRGAIHALVIAVLYDVHGNLGALDAVLADAREAGASRWVLGGDYALFGAWQAETVARLRELERATWIRGNVDRWAGDPAGAPG